MRNKQVLQLRRQSYFDWTAVGIRMKLFVALLCLLAAAVVPEASCGPAKQTDSYQQAAKATLDFIAHEQASGQAEVKQPVRPTAPPPSTPRPSFRPPQRGDTQQHVGHGLHQDAGSTAAPKRDWELLPPRQGQAGQAVITTARPSRPLTPPSYAGVVRNRGDVYPTSTSGTTTQRPRVYNVPIVVEGGRANYTTTTEQSRWYDKLFGKGADVDDDPWGRRRRRQADEAPLHRRGEEREEITIGSNAIRVSKPQQQSRPRPSSQ